MPTSATLRLATAWLVPVSLPLSAFSTSTTLAAAAAAILIILFVASLFFT